MLPQGFQLTFQLGEIVNLAVKYDPDGLLRIRHRLMATFQVNNGKPPESKAERPIQVIALVIGTTVNHSPGHFFEVFPANRSTRGKVKLSANPTHRFPQITPEIKLLSAPRSGKAKDTSS